MTIGTDINSDNKIVDQSNDKVENMEPTIKPTILPPLCSDPDIYLDDNDNYVSNKPYEDKFTILPNNKNRAPLLTRSDFIPPTVKSFSYDRYDRYKSFPPIKNYNNYVQKSSQPLTKYGPPNPSHINYHDPDKQTYYNKNYEQDYWNLYMKDNSDNNSDDNSDDNPSHKSLKPAQKNNNKIFDQPNGEVENTKLTFNSENRFSKADSVPLTNYGYYNQYPNKSQPTSKINNYDYKRNTNFSMEKIEQADFSMEKIKQEFDEDISFLNSFIKKNTATIPRAKVIPAKPKKSIQEKKTLNTPKYSKVLKHNSTEPHSNIDKNRLKLLEIRNKGLSCLSLKPQLWFIITDQLNMTNRNIEALINTQTFNNLPYMDLDDGTKILPIVNLRAKHGIMIWTPTPINIFEGMPKLSNMVSLLNYFNEENLTLTDLSETNELTKFAVPINNRNDVIVVVHSIKLLSENPQYILECLCCPTDCAQLKNHLSPFIIKLKTIS
jgi:hypothetical protein